MIPSDPMPYPVPTPAALPRRITEPDPHAVTVHELKTWPDYFRALWSGEKTFEVRFDDRGYQRGHRLRIREIDSRLPCSCGHGYHADDCSRYTGRVVTARIGYVCSSTPPKGARPGFNGRGYVVLSLLDVHAVQAP